jgi:hypothetical protein
MEAERGFHDPPARLFAGLIPEAAIVMSGSHDAAVLPFPPRLQDGNI